MGSTYENLIALRASREAVVAALGAEPALVAGPVNGAVVVFHDDSGLQPPHRVAGPLSTALRGTVLWFGVFHDDALACQVWRDGALVAEATMPDPGDWFGLGAEFGDEIQEAAERLGVPSTEQEGIDALINILQPEDPALVRDVLGGDVAVATERHRLLLAALGLPTFSAGWGRRYLLAAGTDYEGPDLTSTM